MSRTRRSFTTEYKVEAAHRVHVIAEVATHHLTVADMQAGMAPATEVEVTAIRVRTTNTVATSAKGRATSS